jgi:hypothetical protein
MRRGGEGIARPSMFFNQFKNKVLADVKEKRSSWVPLKCSTLECDVKIRAFTNGVMGSVTCLYGAGLAFKHPGYIIS